MSSNFPEHWEGTESDVDDEVQEPSQFKVLLHNDDYTTMEFVVEILMVVFHKSAEEAMTIMLNVHEQGVGLAGTYPQDMAETKVQTVHIMARQSGFPLRCSIERA